MESTASRLAQVFKSAARDGVLEKTFREQVERHLLNLAQSKGIDLSPLTEFTLGNSGRADTIYNRFVVEWEKPGSLKPSNGFAVNQKTIDQVKRYGESIYWRNREKPGRIVGCCTDGRYFIFVTKPERLWEAAEPIPIDAASCQKFLNYFSSLQSGVPLLPEYLCQDFSSEHPRTQKAIRTLYKVASNHASAPFLEAIFTQWAQFFSAATEFQQWNVKLAHESELRKMIRSFGMASESLDLKRFFFAIHTFFAFLTKLLAYLIVGRYTDIFAKKLVDWKDLPNEKLQKKLSQLEKGGSFRDAGIRNFLEGDFFAWYERYFTPDLADALRSIIARLADYDPATLDLAPAPTQDLLKKIYHRLVPPYLRKAWGEYYTPDWLAEHLLNRLEDGEFSGSPDRRLLDPACGSGTFLIKAINAIRRNPQAQKMNSRQLLRTICQNVVGIDMNPLAVIAARTNYLLALGPLLKDRGEEPLEIPVYLADSIMTPSRQCDGLFEQELVSVSLSIDKVKIPRRLATQKGIITLTNLLDKHIEEHSTAPEEFIRRVKSRLIECGAEWAKDEGAIDTLYRKLHDLHQKGRNGLWARIIKNAFAPVFLAPFDYVVGNPPWINWQNLPEGYREETKGLWFEHGLFVHKGMDAILGKGKKDISTLMTYVAADTYLKVGGKLGFLITQSVFKTSGAGQGFRRLVTRQNTPLAITCADDFSELQPFEGATNRTALFIMKKGQAAKYPVPYYLWRKDEAGREGSFGYEATLQDVKEKTEILKFIAEPVDSKDKTSAWLAGRPSALHAVRKLRGKSDYKAHTGVYTGGANAVYWFEILHDHGDGTVTARNITEGAKRKIESVQVRLEIDLLYPLLRGRDVERWNSTPNASILFVQDPSKRHGIEQEVLRQKHPYIYSWLMRNKNALLARSSKSVRNLMDKYAFYSMFAVGNYTTAKWKVVWRGQVAPKLVASVVSETQEKLIIPDQTAYYVSFDEPKPAHFLCAVLNSTPVKLFYSLHGHKHVSQKFIQQISIPEFDSGNKIHSRLSELSGKAHEASREMGEEVIKQIEWEIDQSSARLWNLSKDEIEEMRINLDMLINCQDEEELDEENEE